MKWKAGDLLVYRVPKCSAHPTRRAIGLHASRHGEDYTYEVAKFWKVVEVAERHLVCITRKGKERLVEIGDSRARKAHWLERVLMAYRFPK